MTKDHKVLYNNTLVPAYKFVSYNLTNKRKHNSSSLKRNYYKEPEIRVGINIFKEVKRVNYTGELLYNVLLENYGVMSVNNLICETLHPNNLIAKIYRNRFTDEYNNNVVFIMNDSIERRNYYSYKKIVNRIDS